MERKSGAQRAGLPAIRVQSRPRPRAAAFPGSSGLRGRFLAAPSRRFFNARMSEALPDLIPEGGDPRAPLAERIARAIWIGSLTSEELMRIGEVLRRKHEAVLNIRTHQAMLVLRPGMEVAWDSPRHGPQRGKVVEIKRTRVVVCCTGGVHLSVSAAMLKPVE